MKLVPKVQILPEAQKEIWQHLKPTRRLGFVLYGGTAIALRLGHRQSVDFDFFSAGDLDKGRIRKEMPFMGSSTLIQDEMNALTVLTENNVKLSFFGGLGFGRYGEPDVTSDEVLEVAALDDLMGLKLKVIFQRAEAKDYKDIAAMLDANVSLERGLAIAEDMFRPAFSPSVALKALTYFGEESLRDVPMKVRKALARAAANVVSLPNIHRISENLSNNIALEDRPE